MVGSCISFCGRIPATACARTEKVYNRGMNTTLNETRYQYGLRLALAAVCFLFFCFIAWQVQSGRTEDFDTMVDYAVYDLRNPVTKAILIPITYLGDWFSIVPLYALLLVIPATRHPYAFKAIPTGTIGFILYRILKPAFARPRPDVSLHLINQGGWAFPSGHSMNGVICYGVLIFLIWRNVESHKTRIILTVLLTALIVTIMFIRIFVGVHYVTDVLGGGSLGLAFLLCASVVLDKRFYEGKE